MVLACILTLRSFGLDWSHLSQILSNQVRFEHAVFHRIREYYGQYSQDLTPMYIFLSVGLRNAKQNEVPVCKPPPLRDVMYLVDIDYIRKDTLDATPYYDALFAGHCMGTNNTLDFFIQSLEKLVLNRPAIDLFCLPNSNTDVLFFLLEGLSDTAEFTAENFNNQILCAYAPMDISPVDYIYKTIERVCYRGDRPFPLYWFLRLIQKGKFYEYNQCVARGASIWDYCEYYGYIQEFEQEISTMLRRGKKLRRYFRGLDEE